MKKITIILFVTLFVITNSFKAETEIKWMGFNEGYALAKKKHKIMLIDVYTDWCGWCKRMDRDAYGKPEIINMVSGNFVAIKFNPELHQEYTYDGKSYSGDQLAGLLSDYSINGYPTTIFVEPKTQKKKMIVGYRNAEQMKIELASAQSELSKKK